MLKLFYAPNACSLAPHIALNEAGADYEAIKVDTQKGEQRSAEYLALNPKARVPSLVTDRGILTEVPVLLAHIARTFPKAELAPARAALSESHAQAARVAGRALALDAALDEAFAVCTVASNRSTPAFSACAAAALTRAAPTPSSRRSPARTTSRPPTHQPTSSPGVAGPSRTPPITSPARS